MLPNEMWEQSARSTHYSPPHQGDDHPCQRNDPQCQAWSGFVLTNGCRLCIQNKLQNFGLSEETRRRWSGNTGAYTLRQMGKDTFILSSDVEAHLRSTDVIDSGRNANEHKSRQVKSTSGSNQVVPWVKPWIVAYSCGDNRVWFNKNGLKL